MSGQRIHRKIKRTPDEQQRLEDIRQRFQRERPSLADLVASGDAGEVVAHGEYLDLRTMLATLKKHRERQGLSLADLCDPAQISPVAVNLVRSCRLLLWGGIIGSNRFCLPDKT